MLTNFRYFQKCTMTLLKRWLVEMHLQQSSMADQVRIQKYILFVWNTDWIKWRFLGSGKSRIIIETINALVRSDVYKKKSELRILVTGSSDDVVDALAYNLHVYRTQHVTGGKLNYHQHKIKWIIWYSTKLFCYIFTEMYRKLRFLRYGNVVNGIYEEIKFYTLEKAMSPSNATKQTPESLIKSFRIVFTPIMLLPKLARFVVIDNPIFQSLSRYSKKCMNFGFYSSSFQIFNEIRCHSVRQCIRNRWNVLNTSIAVLAIGADHVWWSIQKAKRLAPPESKVHWLQFESIDVSTAIWCWPVCSKLEIHRSIFRASIGLFE